MCFCFFFQAEDGIRDLTVTGVQTCALPICHVKKRLDFAPLAPAGLELGDPRIEVRRSSLVGLIQGGVNLFGRHGQRDRKSTRLNSSHSQISYAVFCLKKKKKDKERITLDRK